MYGCGLWLGCSLLLYVPQQGRVFALTPNTMTLNITPMVRTVATTANLDDGGEIYLETKGENEKNAVIMETGKEMNVTTSITLTIPARRLCG